ncbi:MAG TPA: AMP-binding protein, partial [Burkholderiaceae bacterium]|nr:AMP-binding protein [Burkholderiaceae bacterium]
MTEQTLQQQRPWLNRYPDGVPVHLALDRFASLADLLDQSFRQHAALPAMRFMGRDWSFGELDRLSLRFAAFTQSLGLKPGDRVAVMLPNLPQYPVVVCGLIRAGLVVVNVNPLYTAPELAHQLQDAGAKLLVVLENFASVAEQVLPQLPGLQVLLTGVGDLLGPLKGTLVNALLRHVRKQVPPYRLPGALRFDDALARGRRMPFAAPTLGPDTLAVLQYTGGTTGVSKGAMLLHRNLLANVEQCAAWFEPARRTLIGQQFTIVCALPLYHVF